MTFAPYKSSNGHTVSLYGRLWFIVTSASRKDHIHFVDIEESDEWKARFLCSCESFYFGTRPCRHIHACLEALAEWAQVREDLREEWIDRLEFLMKIGHSFLEAMTSQALQELMRVDKEPQKPARKKRQYKLQPA